MANRGETDVNEYGKGIDEVFNDALGKDIISPLSLPKRLLAYAVIIFALLFGLYFFLIAITLLGESFKVLSGGSAGNIFSDISNPITALMIGILATVLVQSSSTVTSIITILVGENVVSLSTGVPMIMGANIGTSVTNTIVAFSLASQPGEAYELAFSGATVHDMFNYLNVLVLLPFELIVDIANPNGGGMLEEISKASVKEGYSANEGKGSGIAVITESVVEGIIDSNKEALFDIAKGKPSSDDCLENGNFTYTFSNKEVEKEEIQYCVNGIVNQSRLDDAVEQFNSARLLKGGFLFDQGYGDFVAGICALLLSLFLLILSLTIIVKLLSIIMRGPARPYVRKSLNFDEALPNNKTLQMLNVAGWLSILAGAVITFLVQSSSITTSVLTPLVAADILSLENMFPFTLGANIGTTATALIAAAANGQTAGLQIALVNIYFNLFGILIWFPFARMRSVPLNAARFLGRLTYLTKSFPIIYICLMFFLYPAIFYGMLLGFDANAGDGALTVSVTMILLFLGVHGALWFYYKYKGGKEKLSNLIDKKEKKRKQRNKQITAGLDIGVSESMSA